MNKSYALVWNATQGCWQVASELTRRRGKAGRERVLMTAGASLIGLAFAGLAHALPTGGAVVDGKGTIQAEGQQMIVDQQSHKLITNWESFNVGAQEGVTFRQPDQNAIALNRVIGNEGSSILGRIDANGQVFLVNPNGVLFGQGAQVNVGSLVASTLNISNEDFKAGRYVFAGDSASQVGNAGSIQAAAGGTVALLGAQVGNTGTIQATEGSVALGAGGNIRLHLDKGSLMYLQIDKGAVDALAHNGGLIQAAGGDVWLQANATNALLRTVVNNEGTIEAVSLQGDRSGRIMLQGFNHAVSVSGKLDASGVKNAADGGMIMVHGSKLELAQSMKASTQAGAGKETGMLELRGSRVRVSDTLRMTPDGSSDTLLSAAQLTNLLAQNQVSLIGDNSTGGREHPRGSTTTP
ncbi:filamentous hemagglutinin N-terminal domain-containing protein [Achromobacter xylosoxidans]